MKCLTISLVLVLACLCAMFEETIGNHHKRPHRDEKRRWREVRGKQGGRWKGRGREAFGHGGPHPRRHRGPQSEEHRSPWWRGEGDYEDPGMWKKEPARGRHDSLWKRWRHGGPRQFEIGIGHSPEDSWFNFDIDFSQWFGVDRQWWKGPNVCTRRTEAEKNETGEIQRHTSVHSKVCDETDSVYKCVTVLDIFGSRREFTEIKECCHGFARNAGEKGCTKRLDLKDLVATADAMNLTEFLRSVDSVGLRPELKQGNFTVFAPVNQAFDGEPNITPELPRPPSPRDQGYQDVPMSNLVLVSRPLTDMLVNDMKQLILGHVVVDALKTSEMSDEQTLETGSPIKSTIRINFFEYPHKLVTANCARILKADVQATNGVIHTVERVLSPVTTSLIGLVSKNEELSILKTLLSKASLVQMLKKTDGHFTLFAPTNSAFEKLPKEMRKKLFMGDACLKSILLQHILPRVICSAVIDKRVRTANMLDRYIALTRDTNDKIFAEGVQVTGTDLMATNGVLHLVDEVIIPDDALSVLEVAQKNGAGRVVELIQRSGLADKLNGLNNITIFAPSDKAFTELDDRITDALEMDGDYMQRVLTFHVTEEKYSASQLVNNKQLKTLHTAQKLSVNEYYNFPFGRQRMKTVECAAIVKPDLRACNGLVHVIDQVMRPPTGTVLDAIRMYPEFKTFLNLVEKVELSNMLQGEGPITVLVPTNLALEDIGEIEENEDQLKEIIKNHIITDTVCCSGIFGGRWFLRQKLRTFSGETFSMDRGRGDTPMIDRAQILACDIMGTNGVIQKIDRVLVKRHQVERRRHFRERGHWDRERGHWDRERGGWGDKFQSWLDDLEFR